MAGSSCPGAPRATYTDASLFTQNSNPVILDTAGRPASGGNVVGIWLTPGLSYKFVVQTSAGVTIFTVDNVTGATSSGGSSTNYWTLAGSTISNNNAGGSGTVAMGGNASVGSNLTVAQTIGMKSSSTQYAYLRAANTMAADVTWRWAATDAAGPLCSDGAGNLSFGTCGGGGGGGSPGGPSTSIQYNNSGALGGSANMIWNNGAQLLTVTATSASAAGIATTGFFQSVGGLVVTNACTSYNCIQSASAAGGMAARSFTATKYVQVGNNNGTPSLTTSDSFNAGALYWDTGTNDLQVYNGGAWVSLGAGSGSPGGSSSSVQYNSAGSFAGSANMTWDNINRLFTVTSAASSNAGIAVATGFIQADAGFLATSGTATAYNSIQAPGGGMAAKSFTATTYIQTGNNTSGTDKPTATGSDAFHYGAMYYNVGLGVEQVCAAATCTGGAGGTGWVSLSTGGGGSPAGSNLSMQYNNSGSFAGTYNGATGLYWDDTNKRAIFTTAGATAAIGVANGFVQADGGFVATSSCTLYNCIQSPSGGLAAKSFTGTSYMKAIGASDPSATSGDSLTGAVYWNTTSSTLKVYNGATWLTLGTSGVTSLNSLTGALSIACAAASSCSIGAAGTTVTITAPQPLATTSTPTFGAITSTGAITSSVSGLAFQAGGGNFQVNSSGAVSTGGAVTSTVGFNVTTTTAVNSIQTTGGIEACNSGSCSGGSAIRINGTQVATDSGYWIGLLNTPLTGASNVYIGTGNFYTRYTGGPAALISCTGVSSGWFALTNDNNAVFCIAGARYRVALTSF